MLGPIQQGGCAVQHRLGAAGGEGHLATLTGFAEVGAHLGNEPFDVQQVGGIDRFERGLGIVQHRCRATCPCGAGAPVGTLPVETLGGERQLGGRRSGAGVGDVDGQPGGSGGQFCELVGEDRLVGAGSMVHEDHVVALARTDQRADHAHGRGDARPAGDEQHGSVAVGGQMKIAGRLLQREVIARLGRVHEVVRHQSVLNGRHGEGDQPARVFWVRGEGVAASVPYPGDFDSDGDPLACFVLAETPAGMEDDGGGPTGLWCDRHNPTFQGAGRPEGVDHGEVRVHGQRAGQRIGGPTEGGSGLGEHMCTVTSLRV